MLWLMDDVAVLFPMTMGIGNVSLRHTTRWRRKGSLNARLESRHSGGGNRRAKPPRASPRRRKRTSRSHAVVSYLLRQAAKGCKAQGRWTGPRLR
jgi:hypothetical protein